MNDKTLTTGERPVAPVDPSTVAVSPTDGLTVSYPLPDPRHYEVSAVAFQLGNQGVKLTLHRAGCVFVDPIDTEQGASVTIPAAMVGAIGELLTEWAKRS